MVQPVLPKHVEEKVKSEQDFDRVKTLEGQDVEIWKIAKLHNNGSSIEGIADNFPGLRKEEVNIALFYYKRNRKKINNQIETHK